MRKILLFTGLLFASLSFAVTHTIQQSGLSFSPSSLNVEVGDVIQWNWTGGVHTTTSTSVPTNAATWDSPLTTSNSSFSYTVTEAGTYNYKCTPHEGSGMVGSFTATVPVGVNTYSELSDVIFYPNPVKEKGYIDLEQSQFELMNTEGEILLKGQNQSIDFSSYQKGMYFLKIFKEGEEVRIVKVVKE